MDDEWQLLEAWRGGDKASGEALFSRYFKLLCRFFRTKVYNPEDAADLVSETLLECVRSTGHAREGVAFRSYLFSIGLNVLRRHFRKRGKRGREEDDFASICVGNPADDRSMTSLISLEEQGKVLVRALRSVPVEQQIVLELNLIEGLNGPEIAELLGVPKQTVYTRLRRGTEKLRKAVDELAASPEVATSTMTGLQTWAALVRDKISD